MNRISLIALALVGVAGCSSMTGKESSSAAQPMQLPPGWTEADVKAMTEAGTPGPMHQFIGTWAGKWKAKGEMWMGPDTPAMPMESTSTMTPIMDGRYMRLTIEADMPAGMGPYHGLVYYGYDNVKGQFVSTMMDNMSTAISGGTGELSSDKKTMTWTYSFACPLNKQPAVMREVDTFTGEKTMTIDLYGPDPKTNKEYRMMHLELVKK